MMTNQSRGSVPAYTVVRSKRKTLALEIGPKGIIVRAPFRVSNNQIKEFVSKKDAWIRSRLEKLERAQAEMSSIEKLTEADIRELADQALRTIPERVAHYASLIGVTYGRITIRNQRTRWGSCSVKGNLNFNCLLMLAPPEVLDSIVVHELCHRIEMNHSDRFYAEVLRVFPDYWKWNQWLKENGRVLMARMTVQLPPSEKG